MTVKIIFRVVMDVFEVACVGICDPIPELRVMVPENFPKMEKHGLEPKSCLGPGRGLGNLPNRRSLHADFGTAKMLR